MNLIDGIIIFMIVLGAWRGFCAGAVKTILSLIAWVCAWFFGIKFADVFAPLFSSVADNQLGQILLAFFAISMTILIIGHVIVWFLLKILSFLKLTMVDKIFGLMLGSGKSLFKIAIFLTIFSPILNYFNLWQQSVIAEKFLPFAPITKEVVMQSIKSD